VSAPAAVVPPVWTEPFRVRAYEVGPDERASVLTLIDFCQETAGYHALAYGFERFDLPAGPGFWVLARFRIEVERFPGMREATTVETWPSARDGLRAERDYVLLGKDGEPFARATSTWFILDVARRRPLRLPPEVQAIRFPERPRALPPAPDEPVAFPQAAVERRFPVRRAELDRVGHANNARFVEWALEAVPDAFHDAHRLRALDAVFRCEAVYGDTIVSSAAPAGPAAWAHRLTRADDGRELAVLRTGWHPA
jgi:acyl-ACP thioesterase